VDTHFKNDWQELLKPEFDKEYFKKLQDFLVSEYQSQTIYPEKSDVFNALHLTAYKDVRVVIIGQDPYHGPNQAHGLCFSVQPDIKTPPSLVNIYKELQTDLGCYIPNNGYLIKWATQGVMMLNTVLTVRGGQAHSHKKMGWETFTDHIIGLLNEHEDPIVFLLWGSPAQKKSALITNNHHHILTAPHPSPLSAYRGFFGSQHFSKTNTILKEHGFKPIDWQIENI